MSAINLAHRYDSKVVERFSLRSFTDDYAGKDYSFSGVKGITVYTVDTVPLVDYTRSGTSRFGDLIELGDSTQEMIMRKDKGFNFSVDKGNSEQQLNIKSLNARMKAQTDEVITPALDMYRLEQWCAGAGLSGSGTLSKSNILQAILHAGRDMSNALVPKAKRALFIKESVYADVKLADQVVGTETLAIEAIEKGIVGMLDGMRVVAVPDSYLPEDVNFLIKYKGTTVDPVQLKTLRVHTVYPGVDGGVGEGRIIYDSFVLTTKAKGLFVHRKGE